MISQSKECKKISASYSSDGVLISKTHKQLRKETPKEYIT
jgi:hypothetical protein